MFSNIFLNKTNILHNVKVLKEKVNAKLCVMVKANAYGHGDREIVKMLGDEVDFFGVSNQSEAEHIRNITKAGVIVFGRCDDYSKCIREDISFIAFSLKFVKEIIKISKKLSKKPKMHLCINSGMNRYGVRDKKEIFKIINLLEKNNIELEGFYTHFSSLTSDKDYTERQKEIFYDYSSLIPKDWKTIKHVGGGGTIFSDIKAAMYRVGLEVYGYGTERGSPVLSIESQIVDKQNVKKGEHVGYLCGFTSERDMTVATIPLGYGDGLPRKLSNKIKVRINGKEVKNVGNVCMDAFMIEVSDIKCKIGDKVQILENASYFAPIIESTEYEVLTNLSKFRGERKIIE